MAVQKTMESMINLDGAKVLFPTSFGYFDPHILKLAQKYPDVSFLHCGGLYTEGKHPKNVGSYFGYIDEAEYVAGIVAGATTKTKKLGFIAAKPIPQVLRNINAFTLGARSVNPDVDVTRHLHGRLVAARQGSRSRQQPDRSGRRRAHRTRRLAQGDHRDGRAPQYLQHRLPRQPGRARAQGLPDRRRVELGEGLQGYLEKIKKGEPWEHLVRGGLKEGFVKMSAYGEAVSAEARQKADAAKARRSKPARS